MGKSLIYVAEKRGRIHIGKINANYICLNFRMNQNNYFFRYIELIKTKMFRIRDEEGVSTTRCRRVWEKYAPEVGDAICHAALQFEWLFSRREWQFFNLLLPWLLQKKSSLMSDHFSHQGQMTFDFFSISHTIGASRLYRGRMDLPLACYLA